MDINRFWELNERLSPERAVETLRDRLSKLEPSEIASYQEHFLRAFVAAYQWDLLAAEYIIEGSCSSDGFMDFRYGLISRGRNVFEAAIVDPDSLVDLADDTDPVFISDEDFGYVAQQVYEAKTGQSMPDNDVVIPDQASGEHWDIEDEELCARKFPKLWAKFGA
jgi:hypothetical protein